MRTQSTTTLLSLALWCLGALVLSTMTLMGCGDATQDPPAGVAPGATTDLSGNGTTPLAVDPTIRDPMLADPPVAELSHPPLAHHIEPTVTPEPAVMSPAGEALSAAEPAPPLRERSYVNEYAEQQTHLESLAVERELEEAAREREERAEMRAVPVVE